MLKEQIERFLIGFLESTIVKNTFIDLDIWSIIHIIFGGLLIFALFILIKRRSIRLSVLFGFLLVWELFEFILYGVIKVPLVSQESIQNVIWDLITSMFGGLMAEFLIFLGQILGKIRKG